MIVALLLELLTELHAKHATSPLILKSARSSRCDLLASRRFLGVDGATAGAISDFLDDQGEMIECIRRDLLPGLTKPGGGRSGLTPRQILRSLVLMRLKNWDYRELRERIADGLTLRQFTDSYCATVPKHDVFQRGFVRLT